ncbi:hypothetical protein V6N12_055933 [Hibiscus sabdariffa]|uniref:Uncharacterized protein n=1 Tax=Hibiscus sabdariffa TaxID=183260 RepID=A0ABR2CR11_9ROSI
MGVPSVMIRLSLSLSPPKFVGEWTVQIVQSSAPCIKFVAFGGHVMISMINGVGPTLSLVLCVICKVSVVAYWANR